MGRSSSGRIVACGKERMSTLTSRRTVASSRWRRTRARVAATLAVAACLSCGTAFAQREFRVYPSFEGADADAPLPPDWKVPGELVIGRLMYPDGRFGFFGGSWENGGTSWTDDYPRGDRTLVQMIRRFTRTNVRAVEQPVNLDDGNDVDYWPFLVVGLASAWQLTDSQAANLREYLLRGGFLFCDSFFDSRNWVVFEESLRRVFPHRPIIDLTGDHPVFHTVFDLPQMISVQIPNMNSLMRGGSGYLGDGSVPHWRHMKIATSASTSARRDRR